MVIRVGFRHQYVYCLFKVYCLFDEKKVLVQYFTIQDVSEKV